MFGKNRTFGALQRESSKIRGFSVVATIWIVTLGLTFGLQAALASQFELGGMTESASYVVMTIPAYALLITVGVLYLWYTGYGTSFIDLSRPGDFLPTLLAHR